MSGSPEGSDLKFVVSIDPDEDGVWVETCPSIPGLEVRAERGMLHECQGPQREGSWAGVRLLG